MATHPLHTVRVPKDIWMAAKRRADREGTNMTAVIVAGLRRYGSRDRVPAPQGDDTAAAS